MFDGLWRLLLRVQHKLGAHPPPGPFAGYWSWRYLNWVKTARMVQSKRVKTFYREFPGLLPPGSEFPQVKLQTTDGGTIDTRQFLGQKHFVLITGAIT